MNELKNKNEIKLEKNEQNEKEENNIFETDLLKYNFDYTTKFHSIIYLGLKPKTIQKFLFHIFLMSTKLNFYNKIICLDRLYPIFNSEKNIHMVYYIISKLMKYIETKRTSVHMINTSILFVDNFITNVQNYYFAYYVLSNLKKINKNVAIDINTVIKINEFIQIKISSIKIFFQKSKDEQIYNLDLIINKILKKSKDKEEKNNETQKEKQNLYLINRIWLENAKNFINNYIYEKKSIIFKEFLEAAFDINNVLNVLFSSTILEKPLNDNLYPFPGPINNFPLIDWKDKLNDPINKEENFLLKKNLVENEDYFWIDETDWMTLKGFFGFNYEVKRKKSELEMVQINAIIFDYRLRNFKEESINYMRKKVIQISKNNSINDLENKIIRCMNLEINYLKIKNNLKNKGEDIYERTIHFYKVNKSNRDIIIEMFLSFMNDIEIYESVFFQEIILTKEDKNESVNEILNKYNAKTEILIIEINKSNKNNNNFLLPIKTSELNCSICNKQIKELDDTKYMCEICSMYIFCSKECAQNNNIKDNNIKIIQHLKLHKYLSDLIIKPFNLDEFIKLDFCDEINEEEIKAKNKGIVGLYNLGNTCYMNCSLQSLFHTKDLTKYFLNNYFQNEINLDSKFGSNGVLLKAYTDLINLMWHSENVIINPYFFRIAFCSIENKFLNNYQQDAMEFISYLLNYFHEDLNRIHEKPYIEMKSQDEKETDIQGSERFNNYHLKRENSIIIDLFNGQFQNVVQCRKCLIENITYEPFNSITLPIPEEHNFYIIKFFTELKCKYITININSETTFGDLVKKATSFLSKKILDALDEVKKIYGQNPGYIDTLLLQNIEIVKLDKNKVINVIYSQPENENDIWVNYKKKLNKYINREEEIILFEREIIPEYHQNIYVYPVTIDAKDENNINFFSYPVVFSVKHDLTLENLKKIIQEKFAHILNNNNNSANAIDLLILHWNRNLNTGLKKIIKEYPKCRFCGYDYSQKKYCAIYLHFNKDDTIGKIIKASKVSEPLVLLARSSHYDTNKAVYPEYYFEENNNLNKYKNIYDSLNQFRKFEFLGEDNLWNCPKCKTKRAINKAIKLYRVPKYLIIQLKRFKKKSSGFFNFLEGDKNETFVSFPTKNLELSNYVEGPEKSNSIYNLYAVINHKSISKCNHFTAFCKDENRWIEFDDHRLIYDVKNPVTNDAYILFYRKTN